MITTILIIIAIALAVAIAAALIYAATQPDTFQGHPFDADRGAAGTDLSADQRPACAVDVVAVRKRPEHEAHPLGAPQGKGAVYEWDGNRNVGAGRIAITDSVPPSRVSLLLDMSRPFVAHNTVDFILEPRSGGTQVTWAMQGRQHFMVKLMSMFISCDKMVGSQFEEGLAKLKALVETPAPKIAAA